MEFGTIIPLYFLTLCCLWVIPLGGLALLLLIGFQFQDPGLARNILITAGGISLLWFLFPFGQWIYSAVVICQQCPQCPSLLTTEALGLTARFGLFLLLPGSASGFLLAYLVVVPVTLIVRRMRHSTTLEDVTY